MLQCSNRRIVALLCFCIVACVQLTVGVAGLADDSQEKFDLETSDDASLLQISRSDALPQTHVRNVSTSQVHMSTLGHSHREFMNPITLFPPNRIPGVLPPVGREACSTAQRGLATETVCVNISVPTLVPFLAEHADTAVVIAPGGGFRNLAYSIEGTDIAKWFNSLGISAFVLKYRVPASFGYREVPMMDAQRAVRYVRFHASEFGLNSSRIGFMGFSAGGDLAAGISANFAVRAYDKIDSIDDVECRPDFVLMGYPEVNAWADNITKDHPPSFLFQAENDPISAGLTTQYYLRLRNLSSAPSDLHLFHGAIHGYGLCNVRDAEGRIYVLVACDGNSGATCMMQAWVPWSDVCLWPHIAKAYLHDLGLSNR